MARPDAGKRSSPAPPPAKSKPASSPSASATSSTCGSARAKKSPPLFAQTRAHRPCVLFFDEVDALGANRTEMLKSGGRQSINQFLSARDGVATSNEGVFILAATNAPWHLNPAFRRPGRFDCILFIPPPPARAAILRLQLKGKPVAELDFDALAKNRLILGAATTALTLLAVALVVALLREHPAAGDLSSTFAVDFIGLQLLASTLRSP